MQRMKLSQNTALYPGGHSNLAVLGLFVRQGNP